VKASRLLSAILLGSLAFSQVRAQPPLAPVRDIVDEYWGVRVHDPYRYMENLEDPQVLEWIEAQAEYAHTVLSAIPGRDALYARVKQLDAGKPYTVKRIRRRADSSMFYLKRYAAENLPKLYYRNSSGEERLLVDPEAILDPDGQHYSLETYEPSPDGRHVVYGLAKGGSEETVLHILDLSTGDHLAETIDRIETAYNRPRWLPDNSGFFYCRRQELPSNAPKTEIYKNTRACFHRLGQDPDQDRVIVAGGLSDRVAITDVDFPSLYLPKGSRFAVCKVKHGDATDFSLYSAPVAALLDDEIPWKKVCDAGDQVVDYDVFEDDIYLVTASGAPRYRVVRTLLADPDFATAATAIPKSDMVVDYVAAAGDALYAGVLDAGYSRIVRLEYSGQAETEVLQLPGDAAGYISSASQQIDGLFIYTTSWTRGSAIYAYDPGSGQYADTGLMPMGEFDEVPGYESHEVRVESHDGVMVPLSIIHRTGLQLDGTNPALITGYGAYGISKNVYFSATRLAWLERGGVVAYAHVRGGGEYGKEWHLAGRKLTKPNTWKDFIACAEYLIAAGYTSRDLIAGSGGSAGGITVGRAITERPELFAAAIINVGSLDAVRAEFTTNGVPNIPEFGTVTDEDEFRGLYAMSSYHHVEDGVAYPAVLLTHGINDPRVDPWMSAKMTARLQAATSSNGPVLFRVDYDAGHGIGSTRDQYLRELADEYAFLLWRLGVEGFR